MEERRTSLKQRKWILKLKPENISDFGEAASDTESEKDGGREFDEVEER